MPTSPSAISGMVRSVSPIEAPPGALHPEPPSDPGASSPASEGGDLCSPGPFTTAGGGVAVGRGVLVAGSGVGVTGVGVGVAVVSIVATVSEPG